MGLAKSSDSLTATFVSAEPAPPAVGANTWVLTWTDADGMPVEDLELSVTPWMPDHGHGTPIEASVAPSGTPGEYTLESIDLFMAGYWEITLDAVAGDLSESLMFGFCVQ